MGGDPLLEAILALTREVGETKGRIDAFTKTIVEQMKASDDRAVAFEGRLRKVENRVTWYSGIAAGLGSLLGFGASRLHS
jgi:hypothetical protein